jgi:hypothetical protein
MNIQKNCELAFLHDRPERTMGSGERTKRICQFTTLILELTNWTQREAIPVNPEANDNTDSSRSQRKSHQAIANLVYCLTCGGWNAKTILSLAIAPTQICITIGGC